MKNYPCTKFETILINLIFNSSECIVTPPVRVQLVANATSNGFEYVVLNVSVGAGSFNDKANESANEKMPSQCVMVDLANQMERFKISRNLTNLLIRALFECY